MAEYIEYHPLKFWLDPASIAEIVAHIQTYLVNNPINSTTEIETIIHDYLIAHPELIGGVDSVNGETGEVVLTADNISAGENVTIKDVLDSLQDQIDDIVASIPSDYQQLIDDVSDLKIVLGAYTDNLFSGVLTENTRWGSSPPPVHTVLQENYKAGEFDIPNGTAYITTNYGWFENSYSYYTDANYNKIGAYVRDTKTSTNYVYAVPEGAVKICFSFNGIAGGLYDTKLNSDGIVILIGSSAILNETIENHPYKIESNTTYYADDLHLRVSDNKTVAEFITENRKIYYCKKDGSGDFTRFVDAINYINDNTIMDAILYVGAGNWDVIDEFGTAYMGAVSSNVNTWGLQLKNRIHLIGSAKTFIKAINQAGSNNFDNIKEYFSVFNAGEKGFTLENINIEDENIRYSVHDDRGGSGSEPYTNKYINCSMIHKNGKYSDCIGAGLGENQTVEIRGCYFEGDQGRPRLVYWHGNNNSSVTDALGKLIVSDNYFAQDGTFKLTRYGQSNTDTIAYVSNNSFGSQPEVNNGSVAPYDNMRMILWNNEIRT